MKYDQMNDSYWIENKERIGKYTSLVGRKKFKPFLLGFLWIPIYLHMAGVKLSRRSRTARKEKSQQER